MDLYTGFHVNRFILEKDITMVHIKTTLELPIAHCLDGAYSGLCVGNVSRDGKTKFDLSTGLIPVLHGHNYFVTVDLAVDDDDLDSDGMVMDFKMMKKLLHEHFDMYDHSMILTPSNPLTSNPSSSTSGVKAHTSGKQNSGTAIGSYTKVEYSGIDGKEHYICIAYRKDGSVNSGDDRGYVLVEKQGSGTFEPLKYITVNFEVGDGTLVSGEATITDI